MPDPVRLTMKLGSPDNRRLIRARAEDAVPASQRVRALVRLWRDDPQVRARIDELAGQRRRVGRTEAAAVGESAKMTVLLDAELNVALWEAKSTDGISIARRVGAGLELWSTDAQFAAQVNTVAAALHAAQRAKRVAA